MDLERRFSRLPERDYPDFRAMFRTACARYAGLPAMRARPAEGEPYREWTYAELGRQSFAAGRWLLANGLVPGDRVAILSENRPEWCLAYIGAVCGGLVAVPLDATLDAAGVSSIVGAASCKALFHSAANAEKALRARADHPGLMLVGFDAAAVPGAGSATWADAVSSAPGEGELPEPPIDGDSAAAIIFTSGTTGVAKGIMLSHRGILANINAARQALFIDSRDVFIAILPLHHTYAATCTFLSPLEAGGSITFVEKLIPTVILRHVRESRVSVMIGVPLLFDKIKSGIRAELGRLGGAAAAVVTFLWKLSSLCSPLSGPAAGRLLLGFLRRKAGLGTVRLAVSGGGPLAPDTADFFETLGLDLVQGYGMSENGPLISVNLPDWKDNRSAGVAVKRTRVRIAGAGPDGVGEIQVKSPSLMIGYLDDPEATAEAITPDGWLRTGDLGRVDGRGFIFITGRSKNLIVTEGGKNVYPEEIELKFEGSRWVREVLVLGRRAGDGTAGEEVIAVIVPDMERVAAEITGPDLRDMALSLVKEEVRRVNKTLPQYMKIVDWMVREAEFEKTGTRKVRRFMYRDYADPSRGPLRGDWEAAR